MDTNVVPKVSVLMPVHNAGAFLREAVESILHQTFSDFEFIIINDGSTDASESIILSFSDPRIVYLSNSRNRGLVQSLNRGLDLARGEYIARMDADDISLPERLQKQVYFMDEHPEVAVCGTAYRYFGDADRVRIQPSDPSVSFTCLASTPPVGHPTTVIRKKVLNRHRIRYEERFQYAADYALWIRISQIGAIVSLPETLLLYRWHQNNMSKYDTSRVEAQTAARTLWYETLLKHPITNEENEFLRGDATQWPALMGGLGIIRKVLAVTHQPLLDKKYFGRLVVSGWEYQLVQAYPIRGFLRCLVTPETRRWSGASLPGLCYWLVESLYKRLWKSR
jgi:glycosyltransferase involved in cell wall biosynthesis